MQVNEDDEDHPVYNHISEIEEEELSEEEAPGEAGKPHEDPTRAKEDPEASPRHVNLNHHPGPHRTSQVYPKKVCFRAAP